MPALDQCKRSSVEPDVGRQDVGAAPSLPLLSHRANFSRNGRISGDASNAYTSHGLLAAAGWRSWNNRSVFAQLAPASM